MGIKNLGLHASRLLIEGRRIEYEKLCLEEERETLQERLSVVYSAYLEESRKKDAEGKLTGNPSIYESAVREIQRQVKGVEERLADQIRDLEMNRQEKRDVMNQIKKENESKEEMVYVLDQLQKHAFGENAKNALGNILARMNYGEKARQELTESLGENIDRKYYQAEHIPNPRGLEKILEEGHLKRNKEDIERDQLIKPEEDDEVKLERSQSQNMELEAYHEKLKKIMEQTRRRLQKEKLNQEQQIQEIMEGKEQLFALKLEWLQENVCFTNNATTNEGASEREMVKSFAAEIEADSKRLNNHYLAMLGMENYKLKKTAEFSRGQLKGVWAGNIYYFNDEYVPKNRRYNAKEKNIGQIKEELFFHYGLKLQGIHFVDNVPDLGSIAIIKLDIETIIERIEDQMEEGDKRHSKQQADRQMESERIAEKLHRFEKMFSRVKSKKNFSLADQILSELQIPLPGLKIPYTKNDVEEWRSQNHFTWHEQLNQYVLVPSIIHGLLPHIGLVGVAQNAKNNFDKQQKELSEGVYDLEEADAPISLEEIDLRSKAKENEKR